MADHVFEPFAIAGDAVCARCSCGWVSSYSHAFTKYAQADHDFHVTNEQDRDG